MAHPIAPLLRPELDELTSYVPASHPGIHVRLDANEAPGRLGAALAEIAARAVSGVHLAHYPDARMPRVRARVAAHTGASPEELLFGSGSDEIIALLLTALTRPPPGARAPRVLLPTPTFGMYRVTSRAHGFEVREVPLDDAWDLDVEAMKKSIAMEPPSLVFLATPNNPTANTFSNDRIEAVLAAAPGALVVVDEAYADYAELPSLRALRPRYRNLAILRTLSKVGVAAIRFGWLEADADLVAALDKVRQPFNVSETTQAIAEAVLAEGWPIVQAEVASVVAERARLVGELARLGFDVAPSRANFLWARPPRDAREVYEGLVARGVLVRSFHGSPGRLGERLRVTVGTERENDALVEALRACLG